MVSIFPLKKTDFAVPGKGKPYVTGCLFVVKSLGEMITVGSLHVVADLLSFREISIFPFSMLENLFYKLFVWVMFIFSYFS